MVGVLDMEDVMDWFETIHAMLTPVFFIGWTLTMVIFSWAIPMAFIIGFIGFIKWVFFSNCGRGK